MNDWLTPVTWAWLAAGLAVGAAIGAWFAPKWRWRRGGPRDAAERNEAQLRRELESVREDLLALRTRLAESVLRHAQQVNQLKALHAAAEAEAEKELRNAQIKLMRIVDVVERGQEISPTAFRVTQFDEPAV